ncbi:hypothetical protein PCASD_00388 [Puccinia coronata f. sp. avenae]|uniref:Uncharacterized protein n=1 Tax=Puccinia coronata f. sp. avenae TaxID=200324 RepID=A0A2N5VN34_9BASI|nr:hypothetical protein PCASD_00388 [Puccinia coronata f. sp. avenae]
MRPSDSNSGARHRVNRSLIQTQRPGRLATEFESVSDSLGGARPSLNRMAASNINLDAAIRARFSGSVNYWKIKLGIQEEFNCYDYILEPAFLSQEPGLNILQDLNTETKSTEPPNQDHDRTNKTYKNKYTEPQN